MADVNVIEGLGTVQGISEDRLSKNGNIYRTIGILVRGFCWENTTGLFQQLQNIKQGDRVRFFAEERNGFVSIKTIFKEKNG